MDLEIPERDETSDELITLLRDSSTSPQSRIAAVENAVTGEDKTVQEVVTAFARQEMPLAAIEVSEPLQALLVAFERASSSNTDLDASKIIGNVERTTKEDVMAACVRIYRHYANNGDGEDCHVQLNLLLNRAKARDISVTTDEVVTALNAYGRRHDLELYSDEELGQPEKPIDADPDPTEKPSESDEDSDEIDGMSLRLKDGIESQPDSIAELEESFDQIESELEIGGGAEDEPVCSGDGCTRRPEPGSDTCWECDLVDEVSNESNSSEQPPGDSTIGGADQSEVEQAIENLESISFESPTTGTLSADSASSVDPPEDLGDGLAVPSDTTSADSDGDTNRDEIDGTDMFDSAESPTTNSDIEILEDTETAATDSSKDTSSDDIDDSSTPSSSMSIPLFPDDIVDFDPGQPEIRPCPIQIQNSSQDSLNVPEPTPDNNAEENTGTDSEEPPTDEDNADIDSESDSPDRQTRKLEPPQPEPGVAEESAHSQQPRDIQASVEGEPLEPDSDEELEQTSSLRESTPSPSHESRLDSPVDATGQEQSESEPIDQSSSSTNSLPNTLPVYIEFNSSTAAYPEFPFDENHPFQTVKQRTLLDGAGKHKAISNLPAERFAAPPEGSFTHLSSDPFPGASALYQDLFVDDDPTPSPRTQQTTPDRAPANHTAPETELSTEPEPTEEFDPIQRDSSEREHRSESQPATEPSSPVKSNLSPDSEPEKRPEASPPTESEQLTAADQLGPKHKHEGIRPDDLDTGSSDGVLSLPNYVQDLIEFEFVFEADDIKAPNGVDPSGMIALDDDHFAAIARVRPRSWTIHTPEKKREYASQFRNLFLATLENKVQIVKYPTTFDISAHVEQVETAARPNSTRGNASPIVNFGRQLYPRWLKGYLSHNDMRARDFYIITAVNPEQLMKFRSDKGILAALRDVPVLGEFLSAVGIDPAEDISQSRLISELNKRMERFENKLRRMDVHLEQIDSRDEAMSVLYHYYNNQKPMADMFPAGGITTGSIDIPQESSTVEDR